MFGEGIRDEVVVVVAMGLDGAVATYQLIARLAVDLDWLCCMLGTHGAHLFGCNHFQGCFLNLVEGGNFVPLQFLPFTMRNEAVLANELAAVPTETLHLALPTLVTLCLLRVPHLLQDLPHLEKVLDVEGGGEAGHAPIGERGGLAAVWAGGTQFVSLCPHQFLQTGLAEDVETGQYSGSPVLLQTHRTRQLIR